MTLRDPVLAPQLEPQHLEKQVPLGELPHTMRLRPAQLRRLRRHLSQRHLLWLRPVRLKRLRLRLSQQHPWLRPM